MEKMGLGKATAVFISINDQEWTDYERLEAIDIVLDMPTHNGITKDEILNVCRWMKTYVIRQARR